MNDSLPAATPADIDSDTDIASEAELEALARLLLASSNVLVLTGAGISTASGIPDYRDEDGVRRGRLPIQGAEFRAFEVARKRYWARSMLGWPRLAQARPNAAHRAIAQLEAAGRVAAVLTQNVDGLHQQAGSRRVMELHGSIHAVRCLSCGALYERARIQDELERLNPALADAEAAVLPDGDAQLEPDADADFHVPSCDLCGGMLQPDVVFFGDGVPAARAAEAEQAAHACDAMLVVGSSLMVLSGFRFVRMAAQAGKPVAAINRGLTRADPLLTFKIAASAESVLPRLMSLVLEGRRA
ncbi:MULTISPECIES: NAD-dependent protein deacetylase [unclassified Herbaspirillum]|uniref:NAD-dependent protein deacetylase n=1 Tax=unclassified Herbaspirillum TaxID=2624150 RepID=UPI0011539805|nr:MULTISPECIES: NAD-dependent protein deacetylase [unclassified Herbaspirillum]MBB5391501.1 NAD-dependent SIR2 family protein deacetylase [Herbaspirillum sp. SJZ102]TQK12815.1 NAD-dependent SIR2 family protein deacetylase [Herbaspirillum sp. SJZ130]TQK14819.1 NAD-dependent SIR2 family protein deacetylase [Herbaspirillum sp. SJZ106]